MDYPVFIKDKVITGIVYYADFREFIYTLEIRPQEGFCLTLRTGRRPLPEGDKISTAIILERTNYCIKWSRHLIQKIVQEESTFGFLRIQDRDMISHCAIQDANSMALIALSQRPGPHGLFKSLLIEKATINSLGFQRKARASKKIDDIKRDDCMAGWQNHLAMLQALKKDTERISNVPEDPHMSQAQQNELRKRSLKMGIHFSMIQDPRPGIKLGGKDYFSYHGADLYLASLLAEQNSKVEPSYSVFMDKST